MKETQSFSICRRSESAGKWAYQAWPSTPISCGFLPPVLVSVMHLCSGALMSLLTMAAETSTTKVESRRGTCQPGRLYMDSLRKQCSFFSSRTISLKDNNDDDNNNQHTHRFLILNWITICQDSLCYFVKIWLMESYSSPRHFLRFSRPFS